MNVVGGKVDLLYCKVVSARTAVRKTRYLSVPSFGTFYHLLTAGGIVTVEASM